STKNAWPLFFWFGFIIILTFIRLMYWRNQLIKTDQELKKIEGELKDLTSKIKDGKKYFEDLRRNAGIPTEEDLKEE
ncbi:MAG: hypothetical protein KKA19_10015, partial [Candidatus Margulisbacteria bacterium]|nr:hypothetical protein [Candidatus Margulisiibacteriota bacterium]